MSDKMIRLPDRYANDPPPRHRKKWERIIQAFMMGDLERLRLFQRTGARGRLFRVLIEEVLSTFEVPFRPEPIFDHIPPQPWYENFARDHSLKLRTDGSIQDSLQSSDPPQTMLSRPVSYVSSRLPDNGDFSKSAGLAQKVRDIMKILD